jgi:hypothetical protein
MIRKRSDPAGDRLRAQVASLLTELNTLIVGADVRELRVIVAALSSSLAHATARFLEEDARESRREILEGGPALTAQEAALQTGWRPGAHTGFSPRWFYEHWSELPFTVKAGPHGPVRFSKTGLLIWLRGRNEAAG